MLSPHNKLMDIDFDALKYIKNLFNIPTLIYFEGSIEEH